MAKTKKAGCSCKNLFFGGSSDLTQHSYPHNNNIGGSEDPKSLMVSTRIMGGKKRKTKKVRKSKKRTQKRKLKNKKI